MKLFTVLSSTALAVLLGMSVPMYAQQDEPRQQDERRVEPEGKAAHPQETPDNKRMEQGQPENRQADKDREKENGRNERGMQAAHPDNRNQHQAEAREGRQGGHIPDDRFRADFGRQHTFRMGQPVMVGEIPRFQYGGYWFVIAQPWPAGWAYTDVVYVDYVDGEYFLLSPMHPGVQILVNVIL